MTLPVCTKTWQFAVNQSFGSSGTFLTDCRNLMFTIKSILIGDMAALPNPGGVVYAPGEVSWQNGWVVQGSSDGAGSFGNGDLVDRWTDTGDLVWRSSADGGNVSWIVLKQTALLTNLQMCIALKNTTATPNQIYIQVHISPDAGFTGGTATARPTATDEYMLRDGGTAGGYYNGSSATTTFGFVVHGICSKDGTHTRIVINRGNAACAYLFVVPQVSPPANITYNAIGLWESSSSVSDYSSYAILNDNAVWRSRTVAGSNYTCYSSVEGYGSSAMGENVVMANENTGEFGMYPMAFVGSTTNFRGRQGTLADMWFGTSVVAVATGTTYPDNTDRKFVQMGDIILPWTGQNSTPGILPVTTA